MAAITKTCLVRAIRLRRSRSPDAGSLLRTAAARSTYCRSSTSTVGYGTKHRGPRWIAQRPPGS
jgi:hypothetical protein